MDPKHSDSKVPSGRFNKRRTQEKRIEKDWEIIRTEQETIMQLIAENRQLKCTIKQYQVKR